MGRTGSLDQEDKKCLSGFGGESFSKRLHGRLRRTGEDHVKMGVTEVV
jgi:hypothetical protein